LLGDDEARSIGHQRTSMGQEIDLLLACARCFISSDTDADLASHVAAVRDWDLALELANRHKVLPLLARALTPTDLTAVPAFVSQRLRELWRANAQRNLLLSGELVHVWSALQSAGVLAIPYRGPALAKRAYGDIRLRQFNDLDLLVGRSDLEAAAACLEALSYQEWDTSGVPASVRDRWMHHCVFSLNEGRVLLELHWRITPRYFGFALDAGAWDRLDSVEVAGVELPALSGADLLLVLSIHGALHGWSRLAWICDLAMLTTALLPADWKRAVQLAEPQGAGRTLRLALLLAQDLFGTPIPEVVLSSIGSDDQVSRLATQVMLRLPKAAEAQSGPAARYPLTGLHLGLREGWTQKVAFLLRAAFVPSHEDWAAVRLPPRFALLYYAVRPLRLLVKHALRLLRGSGR
jgi:hypothetical protein